MSKDLEALAAMMSPDTNKILPVDMAEEAIALVEHLKGRTLALRAAYRRETEKVAELTAANEKLTAELSGLKSDPSPHPEQTGEED
jgi:hypothetical protein